MIRPLRGRVLRGGAAGNGAAGNGAGGGEIEHDGGADVRATRLATIGAGVLLFMALNWMFVFSTVGNMISPAASNAGHQAGYFIALGLAAWSAVTMTRGRGALLPPFSLFLALAWCWLSVSWAIDPSASIRKLTLTTCIAATMMMVVPQVGFPRMVAMLRWQVIATLALCYALVLLWPAVGIQGKLIQTGMDDVGGWRGAMVDKNSCGAFCALAALLFIFDAGKVRPAVRWLALAAALAFLVGTRSKTAMGILAGVVPLGLLVTRYNAAFRFLLVPAVLCVVVVLALTWHHLLSPFEAALYDPQAFTGRGPIWATLLGFIGDHPLLGAGYGSFWGIGPRSPVFRYTDLEWVQALYVGHDGYLDMWSQLGFPGLILVVAAVIVLPVARILSSRAMPRSRAALMVTIVLFAMGDNITESTLFDRDTLLNVVMLMVVALIRPAERGGMALAEGRWRAMRRPVAALRVPAEG